MTALHLLGFGAIRYQYREHLDQLSKYLQRYDHFIKLYEIASKQDELLKNFQRPFDGNIETDKREIPSRSYSDTAAARMSDDIGNAYEEIIEKIKQNVNNNKDAYIDFTPIEI